MWTAIFASIKQLFITLTVFGQGFEKNANAYLYISEWAEESAHAFADSARLTREADLVTLRKQLKLTTKAAAVAEAE